ncbi:MAG TPA: class I SAM-dependent methyltransferase [Gemmataceae bacterium]|nr:class I SAM-dependent methyltransferase [Gemmataceae bacterium]
MATLTAPAPPARRPKPVRKFIRTWFLERTLRRVPKTRQILDLGCGYGFYFSINPHARGVDGDPVAVEYLCQQGFDVQQADFLQGLPYPDAEFEYVIAHDVLEHFRFDELESLCSEVHRILRPGGIFLVLVPNRKGYDYGLRTGAGHQLFVTRSEIERLCQGCFGLRWQYPEPLPRWLGRFFTHNKEVFELVKSV